MSKIINGLRDAENRKNGNGNGSASTIQGAVSKTQPKATHRKGLPVKAITTLFILLLAGINLWQFMVIKGLYSEKDNTVSYLNRIERLLTENSSQINVISSDIKGINSNLQAINARVEIESKKVSGLQKDSESQEFAINNLKKSKDILFDRVSRLEVSLDNIRNAK